MRLSAPGSCFVLDGGYSPPMASRAALPSTPCAAADVARGIARLFHAQGQVVLCEVPLPNGRRADMLAIDGKGMISIVEIKVSRADFLGDRKWLDYLPWCDRFYWAVGPDVDPALTDDSERCPERCGLIVADRYEACLVRPATEYPLVAARRRVEHLRIGRIAMRRTMFGIDPDLAKGEEASL